MKAEGCKIKEEGWRVKDKEYKEEEWSMITDEGWRV